MGNHGAEYLEDGRISVVPKAAPYRDKIKALIEHLRGSVTIPGLVWQDKGYSGSVHYRLTRDPTLAAHVLEAALESAPGSDELEVFRGKMVMEVRAPVGLDKGYAVRKVVQDRQLDGVILIGDDITDVDAMTALADLRAGGEVLGAAVAVLHEDSPDVLVRSADYTLAGVPEVEAFLEWLDGVAVR